MPNPPLLASAFGRLGRAPSPTISIFVIVALMTIASTLLVYAMGLRVAASNQAIIQNQEILFGLADLLSTLRDAETSQRSLLLTDDEQYLRSYSAAAEHAWVHVDELDAWARTGTVMPQGAQNIARLTRQRLANLDQALEVYRQRGPAAAVTLVRADGGRHLMDALRSQISELEQQERAELSASRQQRDAALRHRMLVTAAATLLTLGFLLWAFRRIRRGIADIERQKQLLGVTLTSIGDGVIVTDARGCVTFLNAEAQRLTGWTPQQASNQPLAAVFQVLNEHTRQPAPSPMDRALRPDTIVGPAERTVLASSDGRETPIDSSGAPIRDADGSIQGVVLVFRDVAEQRRAAETLQKNEQRLDQAIRVANLGIFEHDHRCDVISFSPTLREIWGWDQEQPIALQAILDRVLPEERSALAEQIRQAHDPAGDGLYTADHRIVRPDGSTRWLSVRSRTFFEEDGAEGTQGATRRKVRTVGAMLDITDQKAAEEQLRSAKLSAEQASKAKDHFIAVLSHELRNPLNPVLATVSMLQKEPCFNSDVRELLEIIRRNAELEARLIDDLLDVTRIERGKVELDRQPAELGNIIRRAAEVCRPDIEARKLEFGIDAPDGPYPVEADPARLQQVFWNLLKNSIKFTPVGGCVGVRCRRDGDAHVIAEVNDSGEGIAPDVLPRVFTAFEQGGRPTTRQFGGLGLGLTISKAMVEMHGGTITAHSAGKGQGATFTVRLPLLPAGTPVAVPSPGEAAAVHAPARPLRILLVEDHGDTARIMRRLLSAQGHQVQSAADVATALKLAQSQRFDLLLSDLGLPDGSGCDLMRTLRQRRLMLPGIALSGYGQEQDLEQSQDAGFAAHLVKPVNIQRLEEAIVQTVGNGGRVDGARRR